MAFTPVTGIAAPGRWVPLLFTATIFLSASLLFFVQPLFAKIVLPVIGGSPAVWTTAMLFFQSVLILGYVYAHLSTTYLPVKAQIGLHVAIWALALLFLPPALPEGWRLDASGSVAIQTLGLFALGVGVPFALLSSNAPLIQSWYAKSGGPSADDPYFLYGASNLGSLLALLAFPLLAEPFLGAADIAGGFSMGFWALGLGLAASGAVIFGTAGSNGSPSETPDTGRAPALQDIAFWLVLAFVPSSLMLAVTSKISTDIGAVPLIWVIPLALYLLSFVVTFTGRTPFQGMRLTQIAQLAVVLGLCLFVGVAGAHLNTLIALVLVLCFFIVAIWAHRRLYEARPSARYLTLFYVTMSVGGALGGLFNSILAPLFFADLYEGILTLLIALLLAFQPILKLTPRTLFRGACLGVAVGFTMGGVALSLKLGPLSLPMLMALGLGILLVGARKPLPSFAVATGLAVVLPVWIAGADDRLLADRSFFGLHQVIDRDGTRIYTNGTTVHGTQSLADYNRRPQPNAYYHPAGPMGQIMASGIGERAGRIGIVGLGVGSLACYAREGQYWHFYEIDAMVDRVARDPSLFSFLSTCTPDAPTHLGDARVVLEEQTKLRFDVLVIDAYSSDAVPVHLTTLEAMQLYMDRLEEGGVLVYHISNRYYDIGRPLARSAEALGLSIWRQFQEKPASTDPGYRTSDVVMITRDPAAVAELLESDPWHPLASDGGDIWTDDKANPLSILKPGALW